MPLDSTLSSGDSVEIFTSKVPSAGPSRDWLKIVVTPRARNKIRQWFSRERREDAIENGREELVKALRKEGLPVQKLTGSPVLAKLAESMNYTDLDALHAAIGEGHVSARSVAQRMARELRGGDTRGADPHDGPPAPPAEPPTSPTASTSRASTTSWCGCPGAAPRCRATRSSASSPGAGVSACTAPTAPTPPRCPPARSAG